MLICDRDAASVIIRDALGTCPLLFLVSHCLISGCGPTGALLAVAPVVDRSTNSLSSVIHCATLASASRCVAANSDHFLVNNSVDFVRAWSSSSVVRAGSSSIFLSLDAFVFFRD